ncbi:MAG TPA: YhdH/YhfP family quinone oxidoreductase [Lamprocystis sp. (in: g-proteobacteria)]|nr:YhdH/YhfP family quinone oxidoreductase [Lamprocystis sp. (in: g-proteobacteria)]
MITYPAFRIHNDAQGHHAGVEALPKPTPAPGEVLIRVEYSAVNYKDALAGTGRGKILRTFPLVGGADAAGVVEQSASPDYQPGDAVIVTGWGLSFDHDGGLAGYLCCPAGWLVPMPAGLDTRTAMILGTAGFTAAIAVQRMLANGQDPALGPILVTGASGGVGSMAVAIFARLGYQVTAISGKPEVQDWLRGLGATEILPRDALADARRPLEAARWGGAVDNVGGELLAQITRTVVPGGNIASIGLVGGHELHTTVMPFILRGISLLGCNSVDVPYPVRQALWDHLADDWQPRGLGGLATETVALEALPEVFERVLDGRTHGRVLVKL